MPFLVLAHSSTLFRLFIAGARGGKTPRFLRPESAIWEDTVLVVAVHCVRRHVCVQMEFSRREGALVPESAGIDDSIFCINQPAHVYESSSVCIVSLMFHQHLSLFLLNFRI